MLMSIICTPHLKKRGFFYLFLPFPPMSIAEHPRAVEPPRERNDGDGDGISVVFEEKDHTTTVTAHDSVRNCETVLSFQTILSKQQRKEVRTRILSLLTQELNGKPMQVGVFSESKTNGSDTMPE